MLRRNDCAGFTRDDPKTERLMGVGQSGRANTSSLGGNIAGDHRVGQSGLLLFCGYRDCASERRGRRSDAPSTRWAWRGAGGLSVDPDGAICGRRRGTACSDNNGGIALFSRSSRRGGAGMHHAG